MIVGGDVNPLLLGDSGNYQVQRSLRFRASASAYLARTPAASGNRQTWTFSFWHKRGAFGANYSILDCDPASTTSNNLNIQSGDTIQLFSRTSGVTDYLKVTTQVFRDPSAWYHIVWVLDTTNATAEDRVRLYVNGVRVTSWSTNTNPAQNYQGWINSGTYEHDICALVNTGGARTYFTDGYLSEVNFIDGQALTPTSFGTTDPITGQWVAKKYSGTYGTNGFYLDFSTNTSATTLAYDKSGNGNNWTPTGISTTNDATYDSMLDVPSGNGWADGGNGRGNYAVLNPLRNATNITEANLATRNTGVSAWQGTGGTIGVSSGKWYFEALALSGTYTEIGVATEAQSTTDTFASAPTNAWMYDSRGYSAGNGANSGAIYATYTANDVIGVALDMDAGTLAFYKNNVSQGTFFSTGLAGKTVFPWFVEYSTNTGWQANFGQRPFAYTPPTGFKALHTGNLPAPTIQQPNKHFDIKLRNGTGASTTITGLAFQPDLVWVKARSAATDHKLTDSVRGATKALISDTTGAETTDTTGLTAFTADGYTIGADTNYNNSTGPVTYVDWLWKAGGTAVTNNAGSISSQVSANTSAGFSIVTYTGTGANATVGHGLGVAPKMVVVKSRSSVRNWCAWHTAFAGTDFINLNLTSAKGTDATVWNSATPSSTTFPLGSNLTVNESAITFVAYCFAEIAGFSKFGSYTGNGSADGPFVYCGFRPKWILIKSSTSGTNGWQLRDVSRSPYNTGTEILYPNASQAEISGAGNEFDITANGFKVRNSGGDLNTNGGTYIFAAFAESPFSSSNAR